MKTLGVEAVQQLLAKVRPTGHVHERPWFRFDNKHGDTAEIFIFDEISPFGVSATDFVGELAEVTAASITLRINSPGGDVFDAVAIYNALKDHPATVDVIVDGIAASAASFIAMAGDTVTMNREAMAMVHDAQGFAMGDASDMREMAAVLDKVSESIANIYAARTGDPASEWRERMHATTWLTASEAVDVGLADRLIGNDSKTAAASAGVNVAADVDLAAFTPPAPPDADAVSSQPNKPSVDWADVLRRANEALGAMD